MHHRWSPALCATAQRAQQLSNKAHALVVYSRVVLKGEWRLSCCLVRSDSGKICSLTCGDFLAAFHQRETFLLPSFWRVHASTRGLPLYQGRKTTGKVNVLRAVKQSKDFPHAPDSPDLRPQTWRLPARRSRSSPPSRPRTARPTRSTSQYPRKPRLSSAR